MKHLLVLYVVVAIINIFSVFNFFVKLVSVETKKWQTSYTIFHILNLLPRTIGVLQIPLLTLYTEYAINQNQSTHILLYQAVIVANLSGLVLGYLSLPFFSNALKETINSVYEHSSYRILYGKVFLQHFLKTLFQPSYSAYFSHYSLFKVKNRQLFGNNLIASFFLSSAVPACVWAGYNVPDYRATIISSISVINGIAAIVLVLFVDTRLSVITDKAFHNSIPFTEYKKALFDCIKGKMLGTLLGVILLPLLAKGIVQFIRYFIV